MGTGIREMQILDISKSHWKILPNLAPRVPERYSPGRIGPGRGS